MKVYVSGPITGKPNRNREAFITATESLIAAGHEAINPHTLYGGRTDLTHEQYMRTDIVELLTCDAAHFLKGWRSSKESSLELIITVECGLLIVNKHGEAITKTEVLTNESETRAEIHDR